MASVVMADDGIAFDGLSAEAGPLGGAETAFVALAEALAARGHRVEAYSRCTGASRHKDVAWAPVGSSVPDTCDLYIGNRGHRLVGLVPRPRRRVLWLHNPARYLRKPRIAWRIAWYRPLIVTTGAYHASTIPYWLWDGGRKIIPYGVLDRFRHAEPREPPPPRAVFTSYPLRGLDWLIDLWVARIKPAVPAAELHIYAGTSVYGGATKHAREMEAVLRRAAAAAGSGVHCHKPVGREQLVDVLRRRAGDALSRRPGRDILPRARRGAGARGARNRDPAGVGRGTRRGRDERPGRRERDDAFVAAAIAVLRDDTVWRSWHLGALHSQRGLSWDEVAARYEALIP